MARMQAPNQPDPPSSEATFRLVTLGAARLIGPAGPVLLSGGILVAFLTYLHAADRRRARREHLADLFWSTSNAHHSRGALRQTLTRLRVLLGDDAFEDCDGELCLRAQVSSDREDFLTALGTGNITAAVAAYAGEFFPDYSSPGTAEFEQWADVERQHLRARFLRAAETLTRRALDEARPGDALPLARRLRQEVPDSEPAHRLLIEVLAAHRDHTLATVELDALLASLRREGRTPEPATARLARAIQDNGRHDNGHHENGAEGASLVAALVGREREFHALITAWAEAGRASARHVHVEAPAGLGKTRLAFDAATRVRADGGRVVMVRASPAERLMSGALAANLAGQLAVLPGAIGVSPPSAAILVRLDPALSSVFNGAGGRHGSKDELLSRALALLDLIRAVAEEGPLAIIADDVHWMDGESRQILESLSSRLKSSRVLLVTAGRPDPDHPAAWPEARQLTLLPLSVAELVALLESLGMFPSEELGGGVAAALHEATGGSPLLVLESLQHAMEHGELTLDGGVWSASHPEFIAEQLRGSGALERRLAQLPSAQRVILLRLSLAGRPLEADALGAVAPTGSDLGGSLSELERRGFVSLTGGRWEPAHETIAAGAIERAGADERRQAHLAIGRWMSGSGKNAGPGLQSAASHFAAAGEFAEVTALFRKWVVWMRHQGDRRSAIALAEEFGEDTTDPERLASTLPMHLRLGIGGRHASVVGLMVIVITAGLLAMRQGPAIERPDAELIVPVLRSDGGVALHRVGLFWGQWNVGEPIPIRDGAGFGVVRGADSVGPMVMSPDGQSIAYSRIVPDSGTTDLFLRPPDGRERRLTYSPSDDIQPDWSPDERFLVFGTSRWSLPRHYQRDLALLDLASGTVHRLTSTTDDDLWPRWSADGTRIAFVRRTALDRSQICWVTVDAFREQCFDADPQRAELLGWRDPQRVIALKARDAGSESTIVIEANLGLQAIRGLDTLIGLGMRLSPDGQWMASQGRPARGAPLELAIFPLSAPTRRRFLSANVSAVPYWGPGRAGPGPMTTLRIVTPADPVLGIRHRLRVEARGRDGRPMELVPDVIAWRVSDTTVTRLMADGVLQPLRTGAAWVHVTAGGWRSDSALIRVVAPEAQRIFSEDWAQGLAGRWALFGDPNPMVVRTAEGGTAFWPHGDSTYYSGAISTTAFTSNRGMGLEVSLRTPITQPIWQRLHLVLGTSHSACSFTLPSGEGRELSERMTFGAPDGAKTQQTPTDLLERWYRLRVQVFPDGTCGFAIDGVPRWRSEWANPPSERYTIKLYGQSVDTQLLVGPLQVWYGVRTDVDWSVLDHAQPR